MASFLFQRAELYAPDYRGVKDILVVEGRIAAIGDSLEPGIPGLQKIDMSGGASGIYRSACARDRRRR